MPTARPQRQPPRLRRGIGCNLEPHRCTMLGMRQTVAGALFVLFSTALPAVDAQPLEAGKLHRSVACRRDKGFSYALYLPSNFDPAKAWPVVVCLDPGGRGSVPVDLLKPAAERLGYVVAGSNDCKNGPWEPQERAMDALLRDLEGRLNPAEGRCVTAGFSGGARAAFHLARKRPRLFGGVLACGGFYAQRDDAPSKEQAVCFVAGTLDFNYAELTHADRELEALGAPHGFIVFPGEHRWPAADLMGQALSCLRGATGRAEEEVAGRNALAEELLGLWEPIATPGSTSGYRRMCAIASFFSGTPAAAKAGARAATLGEDPAVRAELDAELRFDSYWGKIRTSKDLDGLLALMRELKGIEDAGGPDALHAGRLLDLVGEPLQERGLMALEAGRQREALRCLAAAADLRPRSALFAYNAACVHARLGKREEALAYLAQAAARGFRRADLARQDADLKKIRSDPRFEETLARMQ